jgi:hypothetical protein
MPRFILPIILAFAMPAMAAVTVTVSAPTPNQDVVSPITLSAADAVCEGKPVNTMAYSLDNNSTLLGLVDAKVLNAQVTANVGSHVIHVKSWGDKTACDADIPVTVINPAPVVVVGAVTVTEPTQNENVSSPFPLQATDPTCSGKQVSTMAYSLDSNSALLGLVDGTTLDTTVSTTVGSHTIHVKSWGPNNAACVTDVTVQVEAQATSVIPSDAVSVSSIQALSTWTSHYDPGTSVGAASNSSGVMSLTNSPSMSGFAREFVTAFTDNGGNLYATTFGEDPNATNFFYDGWLYVPATQTQLGNVEMDLNQVLTSGDQIIFGFQCDGFSSTWDYTSNAGTPTAPVDHWNHSAQSCNPRKWTPNVWHHVQIWYSRDNSGDATYHSVWFDGQEAAINATVKDEFSLGWANIIQTQFQVDGIGNGSATVYLDNLTIYRW